MFTLTLKSLVFLAATMSAVSAKGLHRRKCAPKPGPTMSDPPAPTSTSEPPSSIPGDEQGAAYTLADNWVGNNWYDGWDFYSDDDPTNGFVQFVGMDDAKSKNLTYTSDNTFIMRADSTSTLDPSSGTGRQSIRISSKSKYTKHAAVLDMRHMPQGLATWPAYWTLADGVWPYGGEWDIVEGANDDGVNLSSLHTSNGCTQSKTARDMKGAPGSLDCNSEKGANGNQGCGVASDSPDSFGPAFNSKGGGWYATERTDSELKVWFFARDDSNTPEDIRTGAKGVSPANWGKPTAVFTSDTCDISSKFQEHRFIFDLTLCGDWAGNTFKSDNGNGMDACRNYVATNPSGFTDAYWDIAALRIYK
ncbi:hypothetical protein EXIGLDRAFT_754210 [Exidia glandulosa HHB12029]|uniref:GH16 domain-containing protein n=1 Tax=Exidia glandulosa HHB12029 TaxID=1314781 RepID=A0A165D4R6_EXIGL|nr:hypothetical protein EXIGLDRAFT_754210 [Exidia glandulosa HHB12029]